MPRDRKPVRSEDEPRYAFVFRIGDESDYSSLQHHDVRQVALSSSHSVLRQVELVVAPASWRRVGPSMIGADQDSDARRRSRQHVAHRAPWRSDLFQHFLLGLDVVREEQRLEGGGARIKRGMECMGFKPDC